jgi:serine phosphatase RsbU (regulator of sigma subunit)
MFSDGLTEAENGEGRSLSEDEIIAGLGQDNSHDRLKSELDAMLNSTLPHDDISVVTVVLQSK